MFRKLFVLYSVAVLGTTLVFAQTPDTKKQDSDAKVFSFSFDGEGGYLGVQTADITRQNFSNFGLKEARGVAIEKVVEGSPAAAAGLLAGDVIVSLNGEAITSSRKLTRLVSEIAPDQTAKVVVIRGGSEREVSVTVGKRAMPRFENGNFNFDLKDLPNFEFKDMPQIDMPDLSMLRNLPRVDVRPNIQLGDLNFAWGNARQIGIGVTPLTKQLAGHFGVESGVLINEVRENSPAARAGLKAGDIIVEAEGKSVQGDHDVVRAIAEKKEGDLTLTIVRDGNRQTVKVTPEKFEGAPGFDVPRPPARVNVVPPTPGSMPVPMPMEQMFFRGRII